MADTSPAEARIEIQRRTLTELKNRNQISDEQQKVLDAIESGAWTTGFPSALQQGVSVKWGDELIGQARGAIQGIPTDTATDIERAQYNQYSREHPWKSLGGEVLGGLLPAVATRGRSLLGSPVLTGTGAGGIYGLGAGEGSFTERLGEGAIGAGTGGLASWLLPRGSNLIKKGYKTFLADPVKRGVKDARKIVTEAIESGATTLNEAIKFVQESTGKLYTLADLNSSTKGLLDTANILPHFASTKVILDFLRNRDSGRLARIKDDIYEAFGNKGTYFSTLTAIKKVREKAAKLNYDKANKIHLSVDKNLTNILARLPKNIQQSIHKDIQALAKMEGRALPDIKIVDDILVDGNGNRITNVQTEYLHYLQRALRAMGKPNKVVDEGIQQELKYGIRTVHKDLLGYMTKNNSQYKIAINKYAGDSAMLDALDLGYNIMKQNPDELASIIKNMTLSEKVAFRNGTMNNLIDILNKKISSDGNIQKSNSDLAWELVKSDKFRRLLRLSFGDMTKRGTTKFNKFMDNLGKEVNSFGTSSMVRGNSSTAYRQYGVKKALSDAGDTLNITRAGDIFTSIANALLKNPNADKQYINSYAGELARILTTTGADKKVLDSISRDLNAGAGIRPTIARHYPKALDAITKILTSSANLGQTGAKAAPYAQETLF